MSQSRLAITPSIGLAQTLKELETVITQTEHKIVKRGLEALLRDAQERKADITRNFRNDIENKKDEAEERKRISSDYLALVIRDKKTGWQKISDEIAATYPEQEKEKLQYRLDSLKEWIEGSIFAFGVTHIDERIEQEALKRVTQTFRARHERSAQATNNSLEDTRNNFRRDLRLKAKLDFDDQLWAHEVRTLQAVLQTR